MQKTLLMVFIHGFKGGDNTFNQFPEHLGALLTHALPGLLVRETVYPQYDTRGDLHECVGRFKEWLQNKVLDIEIDSGNDKPILNPSVNVILIGHSMGGIVAAETLFSVKSEEIAPSPQTATPQLTSLMFPIIRGVLAYDTPYLGIAPGVVAHGAEGHWNSASQAYSTFSGVANTFGWGATTGNNAGKNKSTTPPVGALPPAASASKAAGGKWGRGAMLLGALGATAITGAAAYYNRDTITAGWSWVGSHLEFVGCLARPAELEKRLEKLSESVEASAINGFAVLYTTLGQAVEGKTKWSTGVLGQDRTFCALPKSELRKHFIPMRNDKAFTETTAHMTMFVPTENPGFYSMAETSKRLIYDWIHGTEWYTSAATDVEAGNGPTIEEMETSPLEAEQVDPADVPLPDAKSEDAKSKETNPVERAKELEAKTAEAEAEAHRSRDTNHAAATEQMQL